MLLHDLNHVGVLSNIDMLGGFLQNWVTTISIHFLFDRD